MAVAILRSIHITFLIPSSLSLLVVNLRQHRYMALVLVFNLVTGIDRSNEIQSVLEAITMS